MLPESAVAIWLRHSLIQANLRALSQPQVEESWRLYAKLAELSPEQVRSNLASADSGGNRGLAVCLLARALDGFLSNGTEESIAFAEWSRFVAQFGDSLHRKADCVEPDAAFLIAAARHRAEPSQKVWETYNEAAGLYHAAQANLVLAAVSTFAQGWVALEAGLITSANSAYRGARELFDAALSALSPSLPEHAILRQLIERGMQQSDAIERAIRSPQPLATLRAAVPIDEPLATMLRARTKFYSGGRNSDSLAATTARLHDKLFPEAPASMRKMLASFLLSGKRQQPAEELFRELLRENPDDTELTRSLAVALFGQGRFAEARPLYEELIALQPDSADDHGQLGMLCRAMNEPQAAVRHLRRALELDPSNSFYADAVRSLEPVVTVRFQDGQMVIGGDPSAAAPGDLAAAMTVAIIAQHPETMLKTLAELDQRDDTTLARKVRGMLQQEGLLPAPAKPAPQAHLDAAEEYFQQHRWEEATAEYQLAIASDEDMAPAYLGLGDVYYSQGKYHLAAAYFEESIEIREDPSAWRFLGDCQRHNGRLKKAKEAYQRALALRPDYSGARAALQQLEQAEERA